MDLDDILAMKDRKDFMMRYEGASPEDFQGVNPPDHGVELQ